MSNISYENKEIKVVGEYDTVIVGGGTAGASAGISSAKGGNRTLIVERYGMLGGSQTNALVCPMMPSYVTHLNNFYEIEEQLKEKGKETRDQIGEYVWFSAESMSVVLEELYLSYGGKILYDATFIDCIKAYNRISAILVMTVEGIVAIKGRTFIDASGDAILTRSAGVPVSHGDEDGNNQMSSLRFEMAGIDVEKYRQYCLSLQDEFSPLTDGYFFESAMVKGKEFKLEPLFQKGVEEGILQEADLRYYQCFSIPGKEGCMSFNCPHIGMLQKNTDMFARSEAMTEGRKMIQRLVAFLSSYMPGFEHAYLAQIANMLGVRESYRLIGKYSLSEDDYSNRARFDDAIAKGDWYIDVHSASKGLVHKDRYQKGEYYEIPYRALICNEVDNMIVAGRCISTTFLMQASIRIQPTVIDIGESAGKASVYARMNDTQVGQMDGKKINLMPW